MRRPDPIRVRLGQAAPVRPRSAAEWPSAPRPAGEAPAELLFLEQTSGLVSLLVWLMFGAIAVPLVPDRVDVSTVVYAVLSLTVVRMLPGTLAAWYGERAGAREPGHGTDS